MKFFYYRNIPDILIRLKVVGEKCELKDIVTSQLFAFIQRDNDNYLPTSVHIEGDDTLVLNVPPNLNMGVYHVEVRWQKKGDGFNMVTCEPDVLNICIRDDEVFAIVSNTERTSTDGVIEKNVHYYSIMGKHTEDRRKDTAQNSSAYFDGEGVVIKNKQQFYSR